MRAVLVLGALLVLVSPVAGYGQGFQGGVRGAIKDSGGGIPRELQDRIFEPFFTTRDADRGSGLGLSVVHGIVTSHGGRIELHTAPGQGSEFAITLPVAERHELISLVQSAA